jgi:hypothetical protein
VFSTACGSPPSTSAGADVGVARFDACVPKTCESAGFRYRIEARTSRSNGAAGDGARPYARAQFVGGDSF